jgi:hypothetical protein
VTLCEIEVSRFAKHALQVDFISDVLVVTGSLPRRTGTSREALQDQQPSNEEANCVEKGRSRIRRQVQTTWGDIDRWIPGVVS